MLMNIILRPGGGDKTRALPRPVVDVKADGPNVIMIRLTFPDNENIQGLRAFTPTGPDANSQFSAINDILPPNTSVERIVANSKENPDFDRTPKNFDRKPEKDVPETPKPLSGSFTFPSYPDNEIDNEEYDDYYDDNYNYDDYYEPLNRPARQQDPKEYVPVTTLPPPPPTPTRPPRPTKIPVTPPQPPVIRGKHPKAPPPPKRSFKRPPPPPPPSPPAPPHLPKSLLKNGKKVPKLYIQSSFTHGNQNFNYNVAVDRQDWKPLPPDFNPSYNK